jgi:hypothetical protein
MYEGRHRHARGLLLRQEVWLCRDRDNAHDPNAVRVELLNGEQLGFIPRELAALIAPEMDAHHTIGITGRVTELSSDANGESFRVQINFYLPQGWIAAHITRAKAEAADRLDYHFYVSEQTGIAYLLLDSDEDVFVQVRELLTTSGYDCTRSGLSYRPAPNGRQYQWYVRFADNCPVAHDQIIAFMREHFGIIPEDERIAALEHERTHLEGEAQRLSGELQALQTQTDAQDATDQAHIAQLTQDLANARAQLADNSARTQEIARLEWLRHRSAAASDPLPPVDPDNTINKEALENLIVDKLGDRLTPELALSAIEWLFPERVVVLEDARRSAKDAAGFKYPQKLMVLLWKLVTEYRAALMTDRGDTSARGIFGENYAPGESDEIEKSPVPRRRRTFHHQGRPLVMMRHLKIGVKDSPHETIRVHFEWLLEEKKIIIGHCGRHL